MHIRVQKEDLNYGLGMVTRAIGVRPIRQVYEGVLMETNENGLLLTCTDGEITIKCQIPAEIEEDGVALLPAKLLAEYARRLTPGNVDIKVDSKLRATIRNAGSNTNMSCLEAQDYPDINDVTGDRVLNVPCNDYRDALSRVLFAVSTDEARKILTGVLMDIFPNETLLVALDGFRMALMRLACENSMEMGKNGKVSAVVPSRIMNEICKMLPDSEDDIHIVFNASHIMFCFGAVKVYGTLLTGEFVDYNRILPTEHTSFLQVSRTELGDAIDRCSLMAREGKNNMIYLRLKPGDIVELSASADAGDTREQVPCLCTGNDLYIAFNSRYLTDIIKNITDDEIRLSFKTNVSPCLIQPLEGNHFDFLVLPVRIYDK